MEGSTLDLISGGAVFIGQPDPGTEETHGIVSITDVGGFIKETRPSSPFAMEAVRKMLWVAAAGQCSLACPGVGSGETVSVSRVGDVVTLSLSDAADGTEVVMTPGEALSIYNKSEPREPAVLVL